MSEFKLKNIKKNKKYSICSCGLTKKLPFCDNSHRDYNKNNNCSYKSVKIIVNDKNEIEVKCSNWDKLNDNIKKN